MIRNSLRFGFIFLFSVFGNFLFSAGVCVSDPEVAEWIGLLGSGAENIESRFGSDYFEISPGVINSRADRIIWYEEGLTFWFADGEVVQVRADSPAQGAIAGFKKGMSVKDVRGNCGKPWIETKDSLYYNLPWTGGPVRLRFTFDKFGLNEIYLFYVR